MGATCWRRRPDTRRSGIGLVPGAGARQAAGRQPRRGRPRRSGRAGSSRRSAGDGVPAGPVCRGTRGGSGAERKPPEAPGPVDASAGSASTRARLGRAMAGAEPAERSQRQRRTGAPSSGRRRRGAAPARAPRRRARPWCAGPRRAGGGPGGGRHGRQRQARAGDLAGGVGGPATGARGRTSGGCRPVTAGARRGDRSCSAEAPRQRPSGASVRRRFAATGGLPQSRPSLPDSACLPTVSKSNRCNSH